MFKSIINIALFFTICTVNFYNLVHGLAIDQLPKGSLATDTWLPNQPIKQLGIKETLADLRRPVWNLAHMVNSIKELDYRLGKGANAVEVDVTFGRNGEPLFTYHGPPCDCWRHCHQQEEFNEYLKYVREIAINEPNGVGKNLSLLFLDLKLDYLDYKGKARAGIELAKSIMGNLFIETESLSKKLSTGNVTIAADNTKIVTKTTPNKLKLVISVNHVSDIELVSNFIHYLDENNSSHLMNKIGFDVGMNDDLQQIESMWKRFDNTLNLWQGDGFTNCFSPFYNLERLSKALLKRNNEAGYPKKVYQWTIDLHDRMRESLWLGVDAIMTNHPERLLAVLQEPDMAHNFRLATREDNPFKKIVYRASARSSETARYQRSASGSTGGGFFAGMIDVVYSWLAYIKEIPFLSLPTTARFLRKVKRHKQTAETSNVIAVKDQINQPEFRVNGATTSNESATTVSASKTSLLEEEPISFSNSVNQTIIGQNDQPPYEGPKWYTSLASNVLVSLMKIILPA